jgi:hypothetical protein
MAAQLFISYSESDKTFAEKLLTALEERGVTCWIAPRDVPPGGSYADAIMRAIEESECFLLVYTTHSNTSRHVLREVERALKLERNMIPIRFDDSQPSRSLDYLLATVQWLSVDVSKESGDVSRVADQITKCVAPREPQGTPKSRAATAPDRISPAVTVPRRTLAKLLIPLLILLAIALGSFVIYDLRLRGRNHPSERAAAALQPQPSNVAEPSPEETAPQKVVRKYFNCFAERDETTAYNLFSKTTRLPEQQYTNLFNTTREIRLLESTLVSQRKDNTVVFVRYEEIRAEYPYSKVAGQGTIELVREGSEWRIKHMRVK